ncbi:MAG: type II secretion system protein [Tepidisphaeraceae bacterium]|jgi:prepilin-type N-terminal cleavage/methylation domain-containing protein/prepilin-type processing-associated H-X9-DG protein
MKNAFTLVELLVVVGIMSALTAILLPAVNAAHQQALSVQCLSNLRQLATAAFAYANTFDGNYPIAYYGSYQPPISINFSWDFTTRTDLVTGRRTIEPGLLWQGSTNMAVQQCPSYDGPSGTISDPYTGYNYNTSYIGHGQYESTPQPAKLAAVRRSSHCALFGDGQYFGGADKYMRAPFPNPGDAGFVGRSAGTQGFRHHGKTNVVFCDGHADTLSQRFTTMSPASETAEIGAGTGFLSPDNTMYEPQSR